MAVRSGVVWQSEYGGWHEGSCPVPKDSLNSRRSLGMSVSLWTADVNVSAQQLACRF